MKQIPALLALAALLFASACGTTEIVRPKVRFEAIYLDMDGTLLGADAQPRRASLEALREYQSCGGKVGLATGRTYAQVKELLPAIAPDLPVVLYNGALISLLDGTVVHVNYLPKDAVAPALAAGTASPAVRGIIVHEVDKTYLDRDDADLKKLISQAYIFPDAIIEDIANAYQGQPVKLLYVAHPGQTEAVKKAVDAAIGTTARALITSPFTVEVVANGVNKAEAIMRVLRTRKMDIRNTMVFGDSGNDIEMLSTIGPSFDMGNCRPAACEAALARIGRHDTDAIANVIRKVALTPECSMDDRPED